MDIEMKYHNVYYYCNIISNMIEHMQAEYLTKLSEFSHGYLAEIPENYCKESVLILFCRWSVKCIMDEDMETEIETLKLRLDTFDKSDKERIKKAFWYDDTYFSFEVERAIEFYFEEKSSFYDWVLAEPFELIEDAFDEYLVELWIAGRYEDLVERIANEMFYILFQNRDFLLNFNHYMSFVHDNKLKRVYVPQWVKRAVFFRDRCKCVCCGIDLSGQWSIVEEGSVHYDHMVSLENGGLNDISNMQLLCDTCNLEKGIRSDTTNVYQNWYDMSGGIE